jgi:hypothetical protein
MRVQNVALDWPQVPVRWVSASFHGSFPCQIWALMAFYFRKVNTRLLEVQSLIGTFDALKVIGVFPDAARQPDTLVLRAVVSGTPSLDLSEPQDVAFWCKSPDEQQITTAFHTVDPQNIQRVSLESYLITPSRERFIGNDSTSTPYWSSFGLCTRFV